MSQPTQLATFFSSRGRPPASAAAPCSHHPALLLPLLLAPALSLIALIGALSARGATSASHPSALAGSDPSNDLPLWLPASFTPEVTRWAAEIAIWSAQYQLPPEVIATVMQIESCGDPGALSPAGAQGLFQVMPFHFSADERPTDPQVNARRGLSYLARSMQLAGDDLAAGFAGYNGGHAVIHRSPAEWPAETQRYARWATGIVREVRAGLIPSPTLQAWLQAGGDYLCRQAASATVPTDA